MTSRSWVCEVIRGPAGAAESMGRSILMVAQTGSGYFSGSHEQRRHLRVLVHWSLLSGPTRSPQLRRPSTGAELSGEPRFCGSALRQRAKAQARQTREHGMARHLRCLARLTCTRARLLCRLTAQRTTVWGCTRWRLRAWKDSGPRSGGSGRYAHTDPTNSPFSRMPSFTEFRSGSRALFWFSGKFYRETACAVSICREAPSLANVFWTCVWTVLYARQCSQRSGQG